MKIPWYDTETTGLTENSAMFQISGVIEIDGVEVEEFDIFCKPHDGADISEQALEVTGMTQEQLEGYQPPKKAYEELISIFSKWVKRIVRYSSSLSSFIVVLKSINLAKFSPISLT